MPRKVIVILLLYVTVLLMNVTKKQKLINLGLLALILALFIGYIVNSHKSNVLTCLDFNYQEEA